ncbi:MAG: hypothetical protein PHE47_03145 [Oscillospiraceae bacterium]|nr:hypothetical protein [Oscillospiraceae bacterium]
MSKVNILWLYDDLLDLYGDWGNLLAVTKGLDAMEIEWNLDHKSLGDRPDFSAYQMVYIGPGKARNLEEAAKDLMGQKEAVLTALEGDAVFLVTGNSRLLFGKSFTVPSGEIIPGIGLFDYTGQETGNVFISDVLAYPVFAPETASYGFINRTAHIHGNDRDPLFTVAKGAGDSEAEGESHEGNLYRNFFGTWQLGPLLVKNPEILKELLRRLVGEAYHDWNTTAEELALKLTLNEMQ